MFQPLQEAIRHLKSVDMPLVKAKAENTLHKIRRELALVVDDMVAMLVLALQILNFVLHKEEVAL